MGYYDGERSHVGNCRYCRKTVYWSWDPRGFWAPPFDCWIVGDAIRPTFSKHHCWWR
jgi:hypothetical protein